MCGVACSSCFYRLREFMLCLVLCGTQLVFFIGCELTEALPAWSAVIWFLSGVDPLMCFQMSGLIKSLVAVRTLERFFSTVNFLVHFQFTICNTFTFYIYAFSRRFYPKRLTLHSSYSFTFYQLLLSLGIEPMILALLAPCSTI